MQDKNLGTGERMEGSSYVVLASLYHYKHSQRVEHKEAQDSEETSSFRGESLPAWALTRIGTQPQAGLTLHGSVRPQN